jgi:hypothetical protein
MQWVNADGDAQWRENGVFISAASGADQPPIVSDREGGAIVAWTDFRSNRWDIYAQRVDASGIVHWTENGVTIGKGSGEHPVLISDGEGGAIITWKAYRRHSLDVMAQRITAFGIVQWTPNGVLMCPAIYDEPDGSPSIVSDEQGGAIITWQDFRSDNWDIYAQRVNATGEIQWSEKGVPISTALHWQTSPSLVSDGQGGAIITWWDWRSGNKDIYAQKVFSDGSLSGPVSSSEIEPPLYVPSRFALFQSAPNPFNSSTGITYELPRATHVTLSVSTITGQRVATLVSAYQEAGHYEVRWDGSGCANGVYLYRLEAGSFVETRRMVLLK